MRAGFDEITGKGLARRDDIYPLVASLIRAERTHRQACSISYRIGGAKLPVLKDLDVWRYATFRGQCRVAAFPHGRRDDLAKGIDRRLGRR